MKIRPSSLALVLSTASLGALLTLSCSHAVGAVGSGAGNDPAAAAAPAEQAPARTNELYRVPVAGLPSIGSADALVTIVEFTDYECPYCQRAEQTIARLRTTYGDALRVVVAERPLPFHERARPAAFAALAADAQGKFEAMHTRLFTPGASLGEEGLVTAARESGLDLARFEQDRNAAPLGPSEQLADGFGVRGTPTFFVSGRRVVGAQPYDVFRDVVEERLAAARALVASGTRPRDVYAALTAGGADHLPDESTGARGAKEGKDDAPSCEKNCDDTAGERAAFDKVEVVPIDGAPSRGAARATITIVAFADFECPFCAKGTATLRALEEAHPGDLRFVFKNDPLPMHPHALLAARAGLAADAQGRFWDFHDRLFARSGILLDRVGLLKVATDLDFDMKRFIRDLDDPTLAERITRDQADAAALDVTGTPTFFVNGRRVTGAQPAAVFEAAIARAR